MSVTVSITIKYQVRYASEAICTQFDKPFGTLEIIDPDGMRYGFAGDVEEAKSLIHHIVEEMGLYNFEVTDNEVE